MAKWTRPSIWALMAGRTTARTPSSWSTCSQSPTRGPSHTASTPTLTMVRQQPHGECSLSLNQCLNSMHARATFCFLAGDFFNYTRQKNGEHCLTMARPVDSYPILGQAVSAYLEFAPKYVMFSGWVGDDDPNFEGLRSAMRDIIHSAWHGYANFGRWSNSEVIGAKQGGGLSLTPVCVLLCLVSVTLVATALALASLGALLSSLPAGSKWAPLCHSWRMAATRSTGHGCLTSQDPQRYSSSSSIQGGRSPSHYLHTFTYIHTYTYTQIVDLYRKFVEAHYELVPYLLTTGTKAFESGTSSITPMVTRRGSVHAEQHTHHSHTLGVAATKTKEPAHHPA